VGQELDSISRWAPPQGMAYTSTLRLKNVAVHHLD
jgi:hypothetical protein